MMHTSPGRTPGWRLMAAGAVAGLLAGGALIAGPVPAQAAEVVVEAEAATNVRTGQAQEHLFPNASGGKTIGFIGGGNGTLTMAVDVVDPLRTALELQYISGEDRDIRLQCNGGAEQLVDLAPGPNWSDPQRARISCPELKVGENLIKLWNTAPAPDVDAIVVTVGEQTWFEAEAATNVFEGEARVVDNASASGGQAVGYLGNGTGRLGIKVDLSRTAEVNFALVYLTGEKRNIAYECPQDTTPTLLDLPAGPNWQTPMQARFSCYIPFGTGTIWFSNPDGFAPDLDALRIVSYVADGGEPEPTPTPTGPTGDTVDPWADDPARAKPYGLSDTEKWTKIEDYSSEFSAADLDTGFSRFPDQWGWRDQWRWEDSQAVVTDGNLEVKQEYDPTDQFNITVRGWQTVQVDLDLQSANTDSITSYAARTGRMGLRHTYYNQHGVRTQQTFGNLTAGEYIFSAWARTDGRSGAVELFARDCSAAGGYVRTAIPRANGDWTEYRLAVPVATGASCKVGIQSTGKDFADIAAIDDTFFGVSGGENRLANPGFESAATTVNKSGGVYLDEPVKYGFFEVRAKSGTPYPGTCLAFWLDGREGAYSTELDIVELGQVPTNKHVVDFAAHYWPSSAWGPNHRSDGGASYVAPWDPGAEFHVYSFEWGPGVQRWFVDGELKREVFDPMYDPAEQILILSLGLRAPYVNNPAAYPDAYDNAEPSRFDYVRVWKEREFTVPTSVRGDYQSSFVFDGAWSGGANARSARAGDTFAVRFDGDGIDLNAPAGAGSVELSVDGGEPVVVDLSTVGAPHAWASPVLERGKHVLTGKVLSGAVTVGSVVIRNTGESVEPEPEPSPSPSESVSPSPSPSVSPSAKPSVSPSVSPSAKPSLSPSVKPTAAPSADPYVPTVPYTKPGKHDFNGRQWMTTCEPYSQTERCRTDIWATVVKVEDGQFVRESGWAFNNLTYLPYMTRQAWKGNPLGDLGSTTKGVFTSGGRQWKTECDTAATGRGACRSYTMTTVYAATPKGAGGYAFSQSNQWVFNNIVMFGGPEKR